MQDSVNDNFIGLDFKENLVIAHAQSIAGLELNESFDIAMQVISC